MASDTDAFEKRVGTVLQGKWTLERLLGVGGMAAVYVGVHKIGRREAIKILHPEVARHKELRARFEQEARAVNQFHHPNAVEVRDIDVTEEGAPYLVMELLEGESLASRAERAASFEAGEVLRVVDPVLDVLAAAHAHGIIHRDVKPDNIFLLRDGRIKVLDFGIARMVQGAALHTRTGAMLGTTTYMPPEQIKGLEIDGRADLFAVGATMFRLLARRRIHEANSEPELLIKMASQPAPPLATVAPHVPREVCLIVDRALAFAAAQRYPDARAMQSDVRAVLRGEPPHAALTGATVPGSAPGSAPGSTAAAAPVPAAGALAPSNDAPTRLDAYAALSPSPSIVTPPSPPVSQPGSAGQYAAISDAHSSAKPPAGWHTSTTGARGARRRPGDLTVLLRDLKAYKPPREVLWIVAAGGGAFFLFVVILIVALSGRDEGTKPRTAGSPGRGARSTAGKPSGDGKTRKAKRSEEPWCGSDGCGFTCDGRCNLACKGERCDIEAKRDAKVSCGGSGECSLWCEGDCAVKCPGRASCVVHCKPGKHCTIDFCLGEIGRCSDGSLVCDQACPD
jgi:serine/threonine protein kinase